MSIQQIRLWSDGTPETFTVDDCAVCIEEVADDFWRIVIRRGDAYLAVNLMTSRSHVIRAIWEDSGLGADVVREP